jgi:hypothetical protein
MVDGSPRAIEEWLRQQSVSPVLPTSPWWRIPPVTEDGLEQFSRLLRSPRVDTQHDAARPMAVVVDHFSQAMLLQNVWAEAGHTQPISVAIGLRLLDRGAGMRMGHDLKDLVLGLERLRGLQVVALWGDFRWFPPNDARAALELVQVGQRLMREILGTPLPAILHGVPREFRRKWESSPSRETELVLSLPFEEWWRELLERSREPFAILQGAVIGRPTLDSIVVNIGWRHLREAAGQTAAASSTIDQSVWRLLQDAPATCRVLLEEMSLWNITPDAHDLRIGQAASLIPKSETSPAS